MTQAEIHKQLDELDLAISVLRAEINEDHQEHPEIDPEIKGAQLRTLHIAYNNLHMRLQFEES